MTEAFIGLGANLGNPAQTLARAVAQIEALPSTQVLRASSVYRSSPINAAGPDYLNSVVAVETGLDAPGLLAGLHRIEQQFGRQRPFPNAPRTLDLDLLLFGDEQHNSATITVPHPRMHERAFVLEPLAEIAPQLKLPGLPQLGLLRAQCQHQTVTRLDPVPSERQSAG
jgi:2-amino-4-hydroxy-6-hydroxymethyldihydropteridine diphosphokinase